MMKILQRFLNLILKNKYINLLMSLSLMTLISRIRESGVIL